MKRTANLQKTYIICTALLLHGVAARSADYPVSSAAQIAALPVLKPGDTIIMQNGIWSNQTLSLRAWGTSALPIMLRAETPGEVVLNGRSSLSIGGDYLVVDGLLFQDGSLTEGSVIRFQDNGIHANNSILRNTAIIDYNPPDINTRYFWVSLFGTNNLVEDSWFSGQTHSGVTLVVNLVDGREARHIVRRNYFGNRPTGNANGFETIQVGGSATSMTHARCVFEDNLFEHCDGEVEIITNKSCSNQYRNNTFRACSGTLRLRHGNDCLVEGNWFLGEDKAGAGGVGIIGERHSVISNYFSGTKSRADAAIQINCGIPDSALHEYFQVKDCVISGNVFVNNPGRLFALDAGYGDNDGRRILLPENVTVSHNILAAEPSAQPMIYKLHSAEGIEWIGNSAIGGSLGIEKPAGIDIIEAPPRDLPDPSTALKQTEVGPDWLTGKRKGQTAVSAALNTTMLGFGDSAVVTANGGSGSGIYEFRQNGGTGSVLFNGTGNTRSIQSGHYGNAVIEARRLGDQSYYDSAWVRAGTLLMSGSHTLPYRQDFELPTGSGPATLGWNAPPGDNSRVIKLTYDYDGERPLVSNPRQSVFLLEAEESGISVPFMIPEDFSPPLYLDTMFLFVPVERGTTPETGSSDVKFSIHMDFSGKLVVYHGGEDGNTDTFTELSGRFTPETWRRVTLYTSTEVDTENPVLFFQIRIDGEVQYGIHDGFSEPTLSGGEYTGGTWFRCANYDEQTAEGTSVQLRRVTFFGNGMIDNLTLTDVDPDPPERPIYSICSVLSEGGMSLPNQCEIEIKSGDYISLVYSSNPFFWIGVFMENEKPIHDAVGQESYEWSMRNISRSFTNQIEFHADIWTGDGKTPLWWADARNYTEGRILSLYESFLLNQTNLDAPFILRNTGIHEEGTVFLRWLSDGPPNGKVSVFSATTLLSGEWQQIEGSLFHNRGENCWISSQPGPSNSFLRVIIEGDPAH